MVTVSVGSDVDQARKWADRFRRRQIPFATAVAITRTLYDCRTAAVKGMETDLDRPTPFTQRGLRVKRAEKRDRPIEGELFAQPIQDRYLAFQVFGGERRPRGQALTLPPLRRYGGGIQLDRYGNIPRSKRAKALLARNDTFSGVVGGVAGIWQRPKITKAGRRRKGSRMTLLLAYAPKAAYRPRWRFYDHCVRAVDRNFLPQFNAALALATRSAR